MLLSGLWLSYSGTESSISIVCKLPTLDASCHWVQWMLGTLSWVKAPAPSCALRHTLKLDISSFSIYLRQVVGTFSEGFAHWWLDPCEKQPVASKEVGGSCVWTEALLLSCQIPLWCCRILIWLCSVQFPSFASLFVRHYSWLLCFPHTVIVDVRCANLVLCFGNFVPSSFAQIRHAIQPSIQQFSHSLSSYSSSSSSSSSSSPSPSVFSASVSIILESCVEIPQLLPLCKLSSWLHQFQRLTEHSIESHLNSHLQSLSSRISHPDWISSFLHCLTSKCWRYAFNRFRSRFQSSVLKFSTGCHRHPSTCMHQLQYLNISPKPHAPRSLLTRVPDLISQCRRKIPKLQGTNQIEMNL